MSRPVPTMGVKNWDARYCADMTCGYRTPTHRITESCRPCQEGVGAPMCDKHACPTCEPLEKAAAEKASGEQP
jgi:hypothetical protein